MVINPKDGNNSALFPSVNETEFESIDFREVELRGSGRTQTIYYFAKDTSTGNEVEVMGEMTEDGFRIIEYCNEIIDTNETIIYNLIDPEEIDGSSESVEKGVNNSRVVRKKPGIISARIILLEVDGDKMHFEEYQYAAPIEYGLMHMKAIPFYFEVIPDLDSNKSGNASNYGDGKKGLNAVNVKVVIAGPSGPFGMEGDLSDYRLVTSNCTLDNATTGVDETTEADEEATSGRSENATRDAVSELPAGKRVYGSDGNTCTNIDVYDLADLLAGSGNGTEHHNMYDPGHVYLFTFIDADSSGTLSEGDRFEFSENYTCDGCDEANMVRLFSISADEFSDGNINPSSEMSAVHDGAMDAIRNIRAVVPSPRSAVCCILAALAISR
jgi:hypothetical protein